MAWRDAIGWRSGCNALQSMKDTALRVSLVSYTPVMSWLGERLLWPKSLELFKGLKDPSDISTGALMSAFERASFWKQCVHFLHGSQEVLRCSAKDLQRLF